MDNQQIAKIQEQIKSARAKYTEALKDIMDMEKAGLTEQAASARMKMREADDKLKKLEMVYLTKGV